MTTSPPQPWNVLIVGKDGDDRDAVRSAAERAEQPIRCFEVETILEAREVLKTARPTCVLVDLRVSDGSGLDLVEEWADVPFIVVAHRTQRRAAERALKRGAQDYLLRDALEPLAVERAIRYAVERKLYQRAKENLEHQDRLSSLGRLSASMAHEVNNPAAFIAANLSVLDEHATAWAAASEALRGMLDDPRVAELMKQHPLLADHHEARALIEESRVGVERIVGIVRQLGTFARGPDRDEGLRWTSLNEIVEWACLLTHNRIERRARLVKELEEGLPRIVARPGRLAQVATNLLVNADQAIQAAEGDDHTVWVRTMTKGDHLQLVVEDSGAGFASATMRRALEPFFTTKPQGEGTGLGLSIANDIVGAHGGTLVLGNRVEGQGARVVVRLPIDNGLRPSRISSTPPIPETERAVMRILLVDDEPAIRRAYGRMLRPHEVLAVTAEEGLARIVDQADRSFDLIICDLMMPGIDGVAFYQRLGEHAPELVPRLVFLTGGAFDERARDFLQRTPNPVLSKPASRDAVLAVAEEILGATGAKR